MFLLIGLFIGGVVLIILGDKFESAIGSLGSSTLKFVGIISVVIFGIMVVVALIAYPCSLSEISKMENFFDRNQEIFSQAVEKFPDAATIKNINGATVTKNLSWKYTNEVLDYNASLKWYKKYQDHWFTSIFVGQMPDRLNFIKLDNE